MELYGKILFYVMPVLLAFTVLDKVYDWVIGRKAVRTMDVISSISAGIAFLIKEVLGLSITILSHEWMFAHIAIFHLASPNETLLVLNHTYYKTLR